MSATMKDLARETGLGLATISSYFNGGNVRETNREKIEIAIKKLDFEVNELARGLKTNHTKLIGVVIPELNSVFCAQVITEVEDVLRIYGYAMVVCDCRTDTKREQEAVDFLLHKRVDGLIIMPTAINGDFLRKFKDTNKPVVLIDRLLHGISCDCVLVDNQKAVKDGVEKLILAGHTKIGIITGGKEIYTSKERMEGYLAALAEYNIDAMQRLIISGDFTISGGASAMEKLLRNKDMTAVFVSNYEMTVGAKITLNEKGIGIPKDLSFIGYDNKEFAMASSPSLSIVSQPTKEIGKQVAQLLITRLGERNEPKSKDLGDIQRIKLETEFIEGESIHKLNK